MRTLRFAHRALFVAASLSFIAWISARTEAAAAEPPRNVSASSRKAATLRDLRQQQAKELTKLRDSYDRRARRECPKTASGDIDTHSDSYKKLVGEYTQKHATVRKKYLDQLSEAPPVEGVTSSGSLTRKDVRADMDYTARDDEAFQRQMAEWQQRGDVLEIQDHKVVNRTQDATLWAPGEHQAALTADGDAMGTTGGKRSVTGDARQGVQDSRGATLDHEKKYLDAVQRDNLKDQAKAVQKARHAAGIDSSNPDLAAQNENLKNYGDDVTSGITALGDSTETRQKKIEAFQKVNDAEMQRAVEAGDAIGVQQAKVRENLIRSVKGEKPDAPEKTEKQKAWEKAVDDANYDGTATTAETLEQRHQSAQETSEAARKHNEQLKQNIAESKTAEKATTEKEPAKKAPSDTETAPPEKTAKPKPETQKVEADTPKVGDADTPKSTVPEAAKVETDVPKAPGADAPKVRADAPKVGADAPKVGGDAPRVRRADPTVKPGADGSPGYGVDDALTYGDGINDFSKGYESGDSDQMVEGAKKIVSGATMGVSEGVENLVNIPSKVEQSERDRAELDAENQKNRQLAKEERLAETKLGLRRAGYSQQEADAMVQRAENGDWSAAEEAYRKMGKALPKEKDLSGYDEGTDKRVADLPAAVVEGLVDKVGGVGELGGAVVEATPISSTLPSPNESPRQKEP